MAIFLLQNLIDKQDNFELIRDHIGVLLADEVVNQMNLAAAAVPAQDPEDYRLNVYLERSQAWAAFQDNPEAGTPEAAPIVNVWYDGGSFGGDSGDIIESQKHRATYNIDVYGYGSAADDGGTGQIPSDRQAAINCHRGVRLVRNILMSSSNTYLQFPTIEAVPRLVSKRMFQDIRVFQPQINQQSVQGVLAARMSFVVDFIETSPQYEGEPLEILNVDINLKEDGSVVSSVQIDFTNP